MLILLVLIFWDSAAEMTKGSLSVSRCLHSTPLTRHCFRRYESSISILHMPQKFTSNEPWKQATLQLKLKKKKKNLLCIGLTSLAELSARRQWDSASSLTSETQNSSSADERFYEYRARFSPSSAPRRRSTRKTSLGILTCSSFKPSVGTKESAHWKHFFFPK